MHFMFHSQISLPALFSSMLLSSITACILLKHICLHICLRSWLPGKPSAYEWNLCRRNQPEHKHGSEHEHSQKKSAKYIYNKESERNKMIWFSKQAWSEANLIKKESVQWIWYDLAREHGVKEWSSYEIAREHGAKQWSSEAHMRKRGAKQRSSPHRPRALSFCGRRWSACAPCGTAPRRTRLNGDWSVQLSSLFILLFIHYC